MKLSNISGVLKTLNSRMTLRDCPGLLTRLSERVSVRRRMLTLAGARWGRTPARMLLILLARARRRLRDGEGNSGFGNDVGMLDWLSPRVRTPGLSDLPAGRNFSGRATSQSPDTLRGPGRRRFPDLASLQINDDVIHSTAASMSSSRSRLVERVGRHPGRLGQNSWSWPWSWLNA